MTIAQDIEIVSCLVESDRFQGRSYQIRSNILEISVYEHIDLPYLTAEMAVVDTAGMSNQENEYGLSWRGTEKVKIRVKVPRSEEQRTVEKNFVVTDIARTIPAADTAETLVLTLVEDIAYIDSLTTLSKAYSGKPETIIGQIMKDSFGREVDVPETFRGSSGKPIRVVIPSISPLAACRWIKNMIVSETGMPFFLYSTLNGNNIFLTDLEYMLQKNPLNVGRDYVYGQLFTNFASTSSLEDQARIIESYSLAKSNDMLKLIKNGTMNSTYNFVDTTKEKDPRDIKTAVNMEDVMKTLVDRNILPQNQQQDVYDDKFTIRDKKFSEYTPSVITKIATSNTFNDFANAYESEDIDYQKLRMVSRALRYYLLKTPLQFTMPGYNFLGKGQNITIGNQVRTRFLKNDPDIVLEGNSAFDKNRSGDYLIYTCRHIMTTQKYDVVLTGTKLANLGRKRK